MPSFLSGVPGDRNNGCGNEKTSRGCLESCSSAILLSGDEKATAQVIKTELSWRSATEIRVRGL